MQYRKCKLSKRCLNPNIRRKLETIPYKSHGLSVLGPFHKIGNFCSEKICSCPSSEPLYTEGQQKKQQNLTSVGLGMYTEGQQKPQVGKVDCSPITNGKVRLKKLTGKTIEKDSEVNGFSMDIICHKTLRRHLIHVADFVQWEKSCSFCELLLHKFLTF